MKNGFIFVYGTLTRAANTETHRFLATHAELTGQGYYCGKLYQIESYPGAVPSFEPDDKIVGEVYRLLNPDLVFRYLDHYEEYGAGFPEPNEFIRRQQKIILNNGGNVTAWIYLYNRSTDGMPLMNPVLRT